MIKFSAQDRKIVGLLLTPSWVSGLIAVVVGLAVSIGVIVAFEAHNSLLQQQLLSWQQDQQQPALTMPSQTLPQNDHPSLQSSWPLLVVWSLVGLVVYIIAASIARSAAQAENLRESLGYVNARPHVILVSTAEHIILRLMAVAILISFTLAVWRLAVPYSIMASQASAADFFSLEGGLYALLSCFLIAMSLHIETILLRLTMGRVRVFPLRA